MSENQHKRIAIGADHRGVESARTLAQALTHAGHDVRVIGPESETESCDYPEPAYDVALGVADKSLDAGVLICGTAIGMSIAANKINGVRAAVVQDELSAEMSRRHNDANVLCMSGDLLGPQAMEKVTKKWLATPFEGGRHARRLAKIEMIERGEDPHTAAADA